MRLLPPRRVIPAALTLVAVLVAAQEPHGRTEGSVTGSFSKAIPIAVPGFRGLEPRLALAYASTMESGLAGVGWRLDGFSTIRRVNSGLGQPQFDANDIYLLGGAELLACPPSGGGASCAAGGTHYTKDETFVRASYDAGNDRWTVWAPDGTRTTFEEIDSRAAGTLVWGQAQVIDTLGNAVTYQWSCAVGECYPASVQFGPYSVQVYRETRPDRVSHASGHDNQLREMRDRLRSVLVARQGQPIRAYKVDYEQSPSTGRSRLASVTLFGTDVQVDAAGAISGGTSLPPEIFQYQDDPATQSFTRWFSERTPVYAAAYDVGAWSSCSASGSWTCTAATSTGCSRTGTQTRSVIATAWTTSAAQAVTTPASSQGCTQTTQGYVGSYSVGNWSGCSSTCGPGQQTRDVSVASYTSVAPGASHPGSSQSCTGTSCTCGDMDWYNADQRNQCDNACGSACVKKQWCGYNTCEPWPNYCWKC